MARITSDLRPVPSSLRILSAWDMSILWFAIIVNVPSYYLAGSLVDLGMSWWQGILTIVAGSTILLFPLVLAAHPGTCYGVPFPILLRSSFGVSGARVPAILRALVACGWCGIESWIGGQAIFLLLPNSSVRTFSSSCLEFACFILFLFAQLAIVWRGMSAIRVLDKFSSPILVLLNGWLFVWACSRAGGFSEMISTNSSRLTPAQFLSVFVPSLTACIGTWAGVALNISDITRYCRSQADQMLGQLGLPLFMGLYSFIGLAVMSSTKVIYGRVIRNPVDLLVEINGGIFTNLIAIAGISLATITTNIPANFIAPANVLVSIFPSVFGFTWGCAATGVVAVAFQPWRILGSSESFVYTWLVGYSAILGPITGILLTDYYLLRSMVLDVEGLYSTDSKGPYYFCGGYNLVALAVLVLSVLASVPGFLHKVGMLEETLHLFVVIYDNAWFFGLFAASVLYWILSCGWRRRKERRTCGDPPLLDPLYPILE